MGYRYQLLTRLSARSQAVREYLQIEGMSSIAFLVQNIRCSMGCKLVSSCVFGILTMTCLLASEYSSVHLLCRKNTRAVIIWLSGLSLHLTLLFAWTDLNQNQMPVIRHPVRCKETGEDYVSVSAAARATGIKFQNIVYAARTGGKTCGYHWQYLFDTPDMDKMDLA
eukprot:g37966.t1